MKYILNISRKQLIQIALIYLIIGVLVSISQWFITNPGYLQPCPTSNFKCISTADRVVEILLRPDFWLLLIIWPIRFIFGFFIAN